MKKGRLNDWERVRPGLYRFPVLHDGCATVERGGETGTWYCTATIEEPKFKFKAGSGKLLSDAKAIAEMMLVELREWRT